MRKFIPLALSLLLLLSAAGCGIEQGEEPEKVSKTTMMLDTVITITLYDWTDASTIDLAFEEIGDRKSVV